MWEQAVRYEKGASNIPGWKSDPMVGIHKAGLTLNDPLLKALDAKVGTAFVVLLDRGSFKIGLKLAETDTDRLGAYCLRINGTNAQTKALILACQKVMKVFPLAKGYHKVSMPTGSMIIEVQLPKPRL